VVDDPIKVMDAHSDTKLDEAIAWWDTSMSSRLNDQKTGAHVIIMQRVHDRDLTGHVLAKSSGYELLALPSEFDPKRRACTVTRSGKVWEDPRTSRASCSSRRSSRRGDRPGEEDLGSWAYAAQHQQLPLPAAGGIFQRAWFKFYRARPAAGVQRDAAELGHDVQEEGGLRLRRRRDVEAPRRQLLPDARAPRPHGLLGAKRAVIEEARAFPGSEDSS
jgi:hypothetical protein